MSWYRFIGVSVFFMANAFFTYSMVNKNNDLFYWWIACFGLGVILISVKDR